MLTVEVENASHLLLVLSDSLYFQTQCICSKHLNAWFTADISREIVLLLRSATSLILSSSSPTYESSRNASLLSILKSCRLYLSFEPLEQGALFSIISEILIWRLNEEPTQIRREIDLLLADMFSYRSSTASLTPKSRAKAVLDAALQVEKDEKQELRVRGRFVSSAFADN